MQNQINHLLNLFASGSKESEVLWCGYEPINKKNYHTTEVGVSAIFKLLSIFCVIFNHHDHCHYEFKCVKTEWNRRAMILFKKISIFSSQRIICKLTRLCCFIKAKYLTAEYKKNSTQNITVENSQLNNVPLT